jgi:methionine biosynthesis protein MetW
VGYKQYFELAQLKNPISNRQSQRTMNSAEEQLYRTIWQEKIRREESDLTADGSLRTRSALPMIERGYRVVDVGCGEGSLGMKIRDKYQEVYGIDISEEAVRIANQNGILAHQANLNVERAPFPDGFFDAAVSLDVIEHVFDPIRFIKEIYRILSPGGYAVISTPNIRKVQRILTLIAGRFPHTSYDPVGYDGGHLHYFTSHDMKDILSSNGFVVEEVDGICGDRRTWKYRLAVGLLGRGFEKEFLSSAILIKARKP